MIHHLLLDVLEQPDAHSKTPTKVAIRKCRIFIEIHPRQLVVAFDSFPPKLLPAKIRASNLGLFIGLRRITIPLLAHTHIAGTSIWPPWLHSPSHLAQRYSGWNLDACDQTRIPDGLSDGIRL